MLKKMIDEKLQVNSKDIGSNLATASETETDIVQNPSENVQPDRTSPSGKLACDEQLPTDNNEIHVDELSSEDDSRINPLMTQSQAVQFPPVAPLLPASTTAADTSASHVYSQTSDYNDLSGLPKKHNNPE
jgi:hypothetical protein